MKKPRKIKPEKKLIEIADYDHTDLSDAFQENNLLKLEDLGLKLPPLPPTQVVSIRLPSLLLNQLRSASSKMDIPYQALIKMILNESIPKYLKH